LVSIKIDIVDQPRLNFLQSLRRHLRKNPLLDECVQFVNNELYRCVAAPENPHIPVRAYSRAEVRDAFAYAGQVDKQSLAELIAKHIPAFERYIPPPRKAWMSEDRRMGIFDAVALGLVFYRMQESQSG
jgi:hypothetical protein